MTFAPTAAISDQGPPEDNALSIRNSVSLVELSIQYSIKLVYPKLVTARLPGATGGQGSVLLLTIELNPPGPPIL